MRFSVLFLIFVIFGFAAFGVLGMTEAMEHGHGFCFAASAGPLCPEIISAFLSHLAAFQNISVSVLQKIFLFAFAVMILAALRLRHRLPYLRSVFSFPPRILKHNFFLRINAAKEEFLSWLAFHEQSPAGFFDA